MFEVLQFLYPPFPVLQEMRARRGEDREIDAWLRRLEVISESPDQGDQFKGRRYGR